MNKTFVRILALAIIVIGIVAAGTSHADLENPFTILVNISPKTIVLGPDGEWITAHTDIALGSVDCSSLTLNGIPVAWTKADARGNLVAKFNQSDIETIVSPPGAILTLSGMTTTGVPFSGSDEVSVIEQGQR